MTPSVVLEGDRLLLCGGFHSLIQASHSIAPKLIELPTVRMNGSKSEWVAIDDSIEA